MDYNSFGNNLIIKTSGASHDPFEELSIENFPKGIVIDTELIDSDLFRRRPKYFFETPRKEHDKYHVLSGVSDGVSNGDTIVIKVENNSFDSSKYELFNNVYRPSHGDYSWEKKYGEPLPAGGGRLSARETVTRVIAGSFAKMMLDDLLKRSNKPRICYNSWTYSIGNIIQTEYSEELSDKMIELLKDISDKGDSIGGSVRCIIKNLPAGVGEPVFYKLQAYLALAVMSIPAARAFEIGRGVEAGRMKGSTHNDTFTLDENNHIIPSKNDAGGVIGGISTGQDVVLTVHFKPIASILQKQYTVDKAGNKVELVIKGSHDVCCVPRAVVIVEAMIAIVLADLMRPFYQ